MAGGAFDTVNGASMIYSTNGSTFVKSPQQLFTVQLNEVRFIPQFARWVAVGKNNSPNRCVIWSNDGINWVQHTGTTCSTTGITHGYGLCFGAGVVVVVGLPSNSAVITSNNGTHYVARSTPNVASLNACTHSPVLSRFVAVGTGSQMNAIYSDDNGVSWLSLGLPTSMSCLRRVVWMFDKFVVTGGSAPFVATSVNGITAWTPANFPQPLGAVCQQGVLKFRE